MANPLVLLETLSKAIKAEQRNGCTNAGVLGGFANFLLLVVDKIAELPLPAQSRYRVVLERLRYLAVNYMDLPARQRQGSLLEIGRLVGELELGIGTGPAQVSMVSLESKGPDVVQLVENRSVMHTENQKRDSKTQTGAGTAGAVGTRRKDLGKDGKNLSNKEGLNGVPVQFLKQVGPQRAKLLDRLGIHTVEDLLNHFPKRFEDRRNVKNISQVIHGEVETVKGRVSGHQEMKPRPGLRIIKISINDGSGSLNAVWFNNPYLAKQLPRGTEILVTGKVDRRFGVPDLAVSDYEILDEHEFSPGIVPVYPATDRLPSKAIRGLMRLALQRVEELMPEMLPKTLLTEHKLMDRVEAYRQMHFPVDFAAQEAAHKRLVFEEFLLLQLGIQQVRVSKSRLTGIPMRGTDQLVRVCLERLPFKLTKAQARVLDEVFADMAVPYPMARLVQGDVGSGKTVIAALALLKAVEAGFQGALMAPTEVLAGQHFIYLKQLFEPLGLKVGLLTGSVSKKEREEVLQGAAEGKNGILVGTHALIQQGVEFKSLGLVVTDEQHRFGVRQRAVLQQKGNNPHVLVMTATPIPRTLALTLYGDLNLSVIDELPPGRKEIKTISITEKSRNKLYEFMQKEISKGRQVYVVCPLVEESEVLDLRAATELAGIIAGRFPKYNIGLLHGRMRSREKESIIEGFRQNRIQILVSTTVIEVGINVPNASIMVVEGAERFGLAQLHQLRGRVGRGEFQSYCLMVSSSSSEEVQRRLAVMCQTNDGFRIAEEDLKIRGPGEFFGTRQHGLPELKIADILRDSKLLELARVAAVSELSELKNKQLLQEVERRFNPRHLLRG